MSAGEDDDDDRLDELVNELSRLNDLLEAAITGQIEEAIEEDDDEGPVDRWRIGTSIQVDNVQEFKELRSTAAREEDVSVPFFGPDAFDANESEVRAHVALYIQGYHNLQEMRASLGKNQFDRVIRQYSKEFASEPELPIDIEISEEGVIIGELVDILEPGASFFGIEEVEDEIQVNSVTTPFNFWRAYGVHWNSEIEPGNALGLRNDPNATLVLGQKEIREVNEDLAEAIFDRKGEDLPEEYSNLLPPDKRREFRS